MSTVSNTAASKALVPHSPSPKKTARKWQLWERVHRAFLESSFRAMLADRSHLHPQTLRERIICGNYAQMQAGPGLPRPFKGTRKELLSKITATVHKRVDGLDYNGSLPYLKILDQLERGRKFDKVTVDSRNEPHGTTCVGGAHQIIKDLKDNHRVAATLAVQRKSSSHPLEHGAAIIECSDGYVLLDARSNRDLRIFSIAFGETKQFLGFAITASKPGSTTPLKVHCPGQSFEYCTNVGNGDDLVMKHFVMHAPFDPGHEYYPIATYNPDGSDRKFIGVSLKTSSLFLKDRAAPKGTRAENISFKWIRENPVEFYKKLADFMKPSDKFKGFLIPIQTVFQQLVKLASQESRIRRLFTEAHPKAI
jgi:hypothetical protein